MDTPYDLDRTRSRFPALASGTAHFDGPGGSQVPVDVADAVHRTLTTSLANRGQVTAAERAADAVVVDARRAVADLLGADPGGVVFGRSMTQLTYDLARALAKRWRPGDEVVVTRLDHDANIRPWVQAAEAVGAVVRWADPVGVELPVSAVEAVLSPRTRLVAVTAASNLVGTKPDVPAIAAATHAAGALLHVDGVHYTPHAFVDVHALGADFYACSPYKFLGPHLGVLAADPALLDEVHPDKLLPSSNAVPERFELGTLPYELLAGTTAAVDFLADLVPGTGPRRDRLRTSLAALDEHENAQRDRLEQGLRAVPGVTIWSTAASRTPTTLFTVDGHEPAAVYRHLAGAGVNAPASHFYAVECARFLGLGDAGAVRAGIAPYTSPSDVDRLVAGVAALVG
ncbi:cysteine desulfurase-like protein [Actinokineospora bangkokensis]|uniref:Cysteine desulfurase-like protein n=1 Tax=Actinokineospora bangkokensis TaxID=1193682 RepID=A0A1Q9LH45_9PSEU|nr:cysteine desulfurase-like protein [Actinokineospora bangkokensis]OLR91368.1 cysteine desulfurase-like protein [Actinokineospora bangkokensis]